MFCPVRPDRLQPGADRNTIVPHQWTLLDGDLVCDKVRYRMNSYP
jgi:hypothetical protein